MRKRRLKGPCVSSIRLSQDPLLELLSWFLWDPWHKRFLFGKFLEYALEKALSWMLFRESVELPAEGHSLQAEWWTWSESVPGAGRKRLHSPLPGAGLLLSIFQKLEPDSCGSGPPLCSPRMVHESPEKTYLLHLRNRLAASSCGSRSGPENRGDLDPQRRCFSPEAQARAGWPGASPQPGLLPRAVRLTPSYGPSPPHLRLGSHLRCLPRLSQPLRLPLVFSHSNISSLLPPPPKKKSLHIWYHLSICFSEDIVFKG